MAPNVAKVDADRQLYLGTLTGYFRDEVVRWLLHGNSLLLLRRTCSSHLSGAISRIEERRQPFAMIGTELKDVFTAVLNVLLIRASSRG
jgi:hypothetical protein